MLKIQKLSKILINITNKKKVSIQNGSSFFEEKIDENLIETIDILPNGIFYFLLFAVNGSSSWYASVDFVTSDWKSVGESQISSEDLRCVNDSKDMCFIWGDWCRLADRNGGDGDATGVIFDIILFTFKILLKLPDFNKKKCFYSVWFVGWLHTKLASPKWFYWMKKKKN